MFERPAAHGQSSTEFSKPSPSESAADARGDKTMMNIKNTKKMAFRELSMYVGACMSKRVYGVNVHKSPGRMSMDYSEIRSFL
jgi:hypothetical protein